MAKASSYHVRFVHAFIKAIMVIIVSEIGDKTFFIAAIFAMKHARSTVFVGALGALGLMTFLSGKVFHYLIINLHFLPIRIFPIYRYYSKKRMDS